MRTILYMFLGAAFEWTWKILQWPVVFALVSLGMAMIYYYAPDAEQRWMWITPGSVVATVLWVLISLGFKFYVTNFTSYNATSGAIGGVIVVLLWLAFAGTIASIPASRRSTFSAVVFSFADSPAIAGKIHIDA